MAIDDYEEKLERELQALEQEEADDDVSKADEPENEQDQPELDDSAAHEAETTEAPVEEPEVKVEEPESKDDAAGDTTSKDVPDPIKDQPTVPIARLSAVTREKRKVERELRESQDTIASLQEQLDSMQAQAEVQGIEFHDPKKGFAEEDRKNLADEFGSAHAETLINMQKQLDTLTQSQAKPVDDPVMDAVYANDYALDMFNAGGEGWKNMQALWAEHETSLYRDFDTDEKRVAHVVSLMQAKLAEPEPKQAPKPKGPSQSLNNVPGDPGTGGDEVDEYMKRGTDAIMKLAESDPDKYERIMDGIRERSLGN